jgi:hypothetical protein
MKVGVLGSFDAVREPCESFLNLEFIESPRLDPAQHPLVCSGTITRMCCIKLRPRGESPG